MYKARDEFYKVKISSSSIYGISAWCRGCAHKPAKKIKCVICGKQVLTRTNVRKYCSEKCKQEGRKRVSKLYQRHIHPVKMIIVRCPTCGKEFETRDRGKSKGMQKYCSIKCRQKYIQRAKYKCKCIVCGREFMSSRRTTKTCSSKCLHKQMFGRKKEIICPVCMESRMVYEKAVVVKGKDVAMCDSCRSKLDNIKIRKELKDSYIISDLRKRGEPETPEIIELTRQRIIMKRTLKQFKKWREENEPNHTDVYGEQFTDEEDHEGHIQAG